VSRSPAAPPPQRPALDAAARSERAFLTLCIALPAAGREALAATDVAAVFTSDVVRRAAAHLRDHLDAPGAALPADDDELAALIAELTVRAREQPATPAALEAETLKLELAHLERQIALSRAAGTGEVASLAARRTELKLAVDQAIALAMGETPVSAP